MAKIKFVTKVKFVNFPHIKIFVLVSALILPLILNMTNIPTYEVTASDDAVKWTKVNIPTEGKAGDWVLADGSDVQHLSIASDGTLYAYGKGLAYTLYRSANGGSSWSNIGNVQDAIVGIATSPNDASNIYYATTSAVYRSTDDGQTFHALPEVPGGAVSNNVEITSIDVTWLDNNIIAVGTRDADSTEFGGVYTLEKAFILYRCHFESKRDGVALTMQVCSCNHILKRIFICEDIANKRLV